MALVFLTGSAFKASWLFVALAGLPLVGALMTADLEAMMRLAADSVKDAMNLAGISDEQGAWEMGISVGLLRRQLRAERGQHLSFARLLMMPLAFWMCLGPATLRIVVRRAYGKAAEDLAARRVN